MFLASRLLKCLRGHYVEQARSTDFSLRICCANLLQHCPVSHYFPQVKYKSPAASFKSDIDRLCSEENCEKGYSICETVPKLLLNDPIFNWKILYDPNCEFCDPLNDEYIQCRDEQEHLACREIQFFCEKNNIIKNMKKNSITSFVVSGPIGLEFAKFGPC